MMVLQADEAPGGSSAPRPPEKNSWRARWGRVDLMLLLSFLALWFAIYSAWPSDVQDAPGLDYYQFWLVGRAEQHLHPTNIYDAEQNRTIQAWGQSLVPTSMVRPSRLFEAVEYWKGRPTDARAVASPFLFATVHYLSGHRTGAWMDRYDHDLDAYHLLSMACSTLAIVALCLCMGYSLSTALLFTAIAWYWCWPLANNEIVGQVAGFQLGGLTLYFLSQRRSGLPGDIAGGLILGLLMAFKPTILFVPLFLAGAWALDGRWRKLIVQACAGCVGLAIAYVMGCLFLHSWSAWADWVRIMPTLAGRTVEHYNYALARVIYELAGVSVWPYLMILGAVFVLAILWQTRRRAGGFDPFHRDYLVASIGCVVGILTLPKADMNYYLLILPLLIYVLRPGVKKPPLEVAGAVVGLLCVFNGPILSLLNLHNHYLDAGLFICGALEILFLGMRQLERSAGAMDATVA